MDLVTNFKAALDIWALIVIGILILANLVLGLFAALKAGKFELLKVADFLKVRVLPYIGGYLVVAILAAIIPELKDSTIAVFVLITGTLLAKIWEQLKELGLPLPDIPVISKPKSTVTDVST